MFDLALFLFLDLILAIFCSCYEVNNAYRDQLEKSGMVFSGINEKLDLVEIVELPSHPFFVGVQFHPELKSTVENPHPIFLQFVKAAATRKAVKKELALHSDSDI